MVAQPVRHPVIHREDRHRHTDVGVLDDEGWLSTLPKRPITMGREVAGVIAQLGDGVSSWRQGDRGWASALRRRPAHLASFVTAASRSRWRSISRRCFGSPTSSRSCWRRRHGHRDDLPSRRDHERRRDGGRLAPYGCTPCDPPRAARTRRGDRASWRSLPLIRGHCRSDKKQPLTR